MAARSRAITYVARWRKYRPVQKSYHTDVVVTDPCPPPSTLWRMRDRGCRCDETLCTVVYCWLTMEQRRGKRQARTRVPFTRQYRNFSTTCTYHDRDIFTASSTYVRMTNFVDDLGFFLISPRFPENIANNGTQIFLVRSTRTFRRPRVFLRKFRCKFLRVILDSIFDA